MFPFELSFRARSSGLPFRNHRATILTGPDHSSYPRHEPKGGCPKNRFNGNHKLARKLAGLQRRGPGTECNPFLGSPYDQCAANQLVVVCGEVMKEHRKFQSSVKMEYPIAAWQGSGRAGLRNPLGQCRAVPQFRRADPGRAGFPLAGSLPVRLPNWPRLPGSDFLSH